MDPRLVAVADRREELGLQSDRRHPEVLDLHHLVVARAEPFGPPVLHRAMKGVEQARVVRDAGAVDVAEAVAVALAEEHSAAD